MGMRYTTWDIRPQAAAEAERLHVRVAAAEAEAAQLRGALDAGMQVHEQEAQALEALEAGAREELEATQARARASLARAATAEAKLTAAEAALAAAEKVRALGHSLRLTVSEL
jgi:siderophore synthetase component